MHHHPPPHSPFNRDWLTRQEPPLFKWLVVSQLLLLRVGPKIWPRVFCPFPVSLLQLQEPTCKQTLSMFLSDSSSSYLQGFPFSASPGAHLSFWCDCLWLPHLHLQAPGPSTVLHFYVQLSCLALSINTLCIYLAYTATATRYLSGSCFSPALRTVSAHRRSSVNIYEKNNMKTQ